MTLLEHDFVEGFKRLCRDAWSRGWHEANGGNLSYRLSIQDREAIMQGPSSMGPWYELEAAMPALGGEMFLMTASGAYLNQVAAGAAQALGIIELNSDASAYRTIWGFENGARPSSELMTHLAVYDAALSSGDLADRVVYHAHCPHVIAASTILAPSSRTWTRTLWRCMTECIIVFPQGIGATEWMVPGSPELAQMTAQVMNTQRACVWPQHGIMARAASLDEAFGIVDTVEKACKIYIEACAACGGTEPRYLVDDRQLRAICQRYGIEPNEDYLD